MDLNQLWTELNERQADGLACVICGADYLQVDAVHQPVGRSVTGSQVFACTGCITRLPVTKPGEVP